MAKETAVVEFIMEKKNRKVDLEIPLYISANELVIALNQAYQLGIDITNARECYLKAERPIALLHGNRELKEFGIRNGSIIYYTE